MSQGCLYAARWILPVTVPPLRDHAMLVDGEGKIAQIAPRDSFTGFEGPVHEFGEAAILPGLINVHAHPELAAFRGLLDDLPFHQWIPTLMRCKRGAQLSMDDYEVSAQWTCVESLRAGVTTMGATEDSGAAVRALSDAGMRGVVFLETFGPAPADAHAALGSLQEKLDFQAKHASHRVRLGVSPHAPYSVSDELYQRVGEFARRENLPVATHAAEAEAEELLVREAMGPFAAGLRSRGIAVEPRGTSTIDLLSRTGILDCAPLVIHAVRVSPEDLQLLSASGSTIAHCPVANARLGHGCAPAVEALAAGVRIAIGTDSVASNNRIDLLEEARAAQIVQRARLQSASVLPAPDLLRMITIDAAGALGMAGRIGSLDAGKEADFCVVRLDTANSIPVNDPYAALFHSARGSDVILTAVSGRILFDEGGVTSLPEPELAQRVNNIADRLCAVRADV